MIDDAARPTPARRWLRPRAHEPADQRHRPLQHPLLLLHAGRQRRVHGPRSELLTFEEIERFVRVVAGLGVNKIRLTGGEPLVRRELHKLVAKIAPIPGITDVGLTTNGILLAEQAPSAVGRGPASAQRQPRRAPPEKFKQITRRDGYEKVHRRNSRCQESVFSPVKVNAVSVRGLTEDEIVPFGHFARETGVEMRFIEYMPLDADCAWQREKVLFAHEIIDTLVARDHAARAAARAGPAPRRPNSYSLTASAALALSPRSASPSA